MSGRDGGLHARQPRPAKALTDYAFGRNFEPMKAASTNGALRIEDNANVNGHNPPPARLRSTMVMTWLGTTTSVQIQSVR